MLVLCSVWISNPQPPYHLTAKQLHHNNQTNLRTPNTAFVCVREIGNPRIYPVTWLLDAEVERGRGTWKDTRERRQDNIILVFDNFFYSKIKLTNQLRDVINWTFDLQTHDFKFESTFFGLFIIFWLLYKLEH